MFTEPNMLKIILLGDSNVGKTALMHRYTKNIFTPFGKSTVGVEFVTKEFEIGDSRATLQIWDTAGQERFDSLCTAYYRGSDGCVFVYDLTNQKSFERLNHWYIQFIRYAAPKDEKHFPFVLVGNKMDMPGKRKVSIIQADEWCNSRYQCPYYETSAKNGNNVDFAFEKVAEMAIGRALMAQPNHAPDEIFVPKPPGQQTCNMC